MPTNLVKSEFKHNNRRQTRNKMGLNNNAIMKNLKRNLSRSDDLDKSTDLSE